MTNCSAAARVGECLIDDAIEVAVRMGDLLVAGAVRA
jgi:hypothetical protein